MEALGGGAVSFEPGTPSLECLVFGVQCLGMRCMASGLGFRVEGSGFMVWG